MLKLYISDLKYKKTIYEEDGASTSMFNILLSDGSGANLFYRLMQACSKNILMLPGALFFQYINKLLNHCVIGIRSDFGPGFVLMHPTGVVINSKVVGGKNIVLESGVVVGDDKGNSPVLGDGIFVGAGAKIIGGLSVGDNVKVGANAVVVKNVASNLTVVGIPARPI